MEEIRIGLLGLGTIEQASPRFLCLTVKHWKKKSGHRLF